ncbi:polysaccharide deacetylase family protein [Ulvibacterium marinum]|uniref:polysaccharide deacetylase family protein n=1 Tax=Ulvibacterium marinum TaxID=2419782 RepID=UPI00249551E2|nr:polysaccharide deacetylase family protein [Ulvibacterium marinum]
MHLRIIIFFAWAFQGFSLLGQEKTVAERLGYPADTKLLIIHADDLGVAHSENRASIYALEKSPVNSASIMVPCPWFPEIVAYAIENPKMDLGLHLTLTSEWKYYKWGPVTSKDSVSSLIGKDGYFYPLVPDFVAHAKPEEVALELRNQIKRAYASGIDVTHLDAHMGAAASTPEHIATYMRLGKEFRLPVLLDSRIHAVEDVKIKSLLDESTVVMDYIHSILPTDFEKGSTQYYTQLLRTLKPGITCLLIHLAYDDDEMQGIAVNHPEWGAAWRQEDLDFFTSKECVQLLKENDIVLVTWREIRDKITRAK